jgi:hypothetical protein
MRVARSSLTTVFAVVVAFAFSPHHGAAAAAAPGWKAGVAKVKITPERPMWLSGYAGRDKPAEGTLHELWAKALALEDSSGRRVVMVTADLVGVDRNLSLRFRARVQELHGLGKDAVALCLSHTHTGPVVGNNLKPMYLLGDAQGKLADEYAAQLEDKLVDVAGEALESLAPARLQWGTGRATFAVNRRNNPEAQVPKLRAEGNLVGPVDYDLPVLSVRDPADGKLRAVLFGYACHATVLAYFMWSGDWPGFAQIELEKAHPEAMALFWAGCGADQNPLPRRTVELAQDYGRQAAAGVDAVLNGVMKPVAPDDRLALGYSELDLPFAKLPTREELQADMASKELAVANRAKMLLERLDREGKLSPTYPYPVQVWQMGPDLTFVLLGGEVVVDYSLRLKKELGPDRTWVAGYANDVMAYIPSLRVLKEGGYEGSLAMVFYGQPSPWREEVEEMIVKEVKRLAASR